MLETTLSADIQKGVALMRAGRADEASAWYRDILAREPGREDALHYLGLARLQLRDLDGARKHLQRAAELHPNSANILADLGTALVRSGQYVQALEAFAKALEIDASHPDALNNSAVTLGALQRPYDALPYLKRLVRIRGDSADAWAQLAETHLMLNQPEEAISGFRKALELDSGRERERLLLGEALEAAGRFKEAQFQYSLVHERHPGNTLAVAKLLGLRDFQADPSIPETANAMLQSAELEDDARLRLHLALGQYHDTRGEYDDAFANVEAAHRITGNGRDFDSASFAKAIDRLIAYFTSARFERLRGGVSETTRPIFIVGMPRSGTTLVEQILASHSDVSAGGELLAIMDICSRVQDLATDGHPYPTGIDSLKDQDLDKLAQSYLDRLQRVSTSSAKVTDKLPFNFMHLGLIAILFPNSKIVHCRRNALDTCLSCYFVSFSKELQFASNLRTLGRYYRAYQRIMDHWQAVLPVPIYHLDYEQLVRDPQREVTELLLHCDLQWEANCMRFYETERGVRTPSRWQVRQPIYGNSVERWRHYERHLAPLMESLSGK